MYVIFEDEIYIAEMKITVRFGGIKFNTFISIYFLVASVNTPSFGKLTTFNMHGKISILKMRSISLNLRKELFHFFDCRCPKVMPS